MASLAICVLSYINKAICKPQSYFTHAFNLPFPTVMHRCLDTDFLQKYEEVFVIGDIHGCYDELVMLLEKAGAMKDSILKIFVGDLVNKGPKNAEVLDLVMKSSSMLVVRGNHDEIVLNEYYNSQNNGYKLKEKYFWIKNLSLESIEYLLDLPYTISLPSLNAVIVHAGLVPGVPINVNDPYDMVYMRNIVEKDYFWDGGLRATKHASEGKPWASLWGGPQHVYFGHDAMRLLQEYPYATGLDTGCVYGNSLTGLFIGGPRKGSYVKVNALKVHEQPKGLVESHGV